MNATQTLRSALRMSYEWIKPLADDLADAPLTSPTSGRGNHPTWIMGHLTFSSAGLLSMMSGEPSVCEKWKDIFQGGTQPSYDASVYPSYGDILGTYEQTHRATLALLDEFGEARLDEKPVAVWDEVKDLPEFQTNGRLFLFIAMHEMSHRGQLADARRVLERKPFA